MKLPSGTVTVPVAPTPPDYDAATAGYLIPEDPVTQAAGSEDQAFYQNYLIRMLKNVCDTAGSDNPSAGYEDVTELTRAIQTMTSAANANLLNGPLPEQVSTTQLRLLQGTNVMLGGVPVTLSTNLTTDLGVVTTNNATINGRTFATITANTDIYWFVVRGSSGVGTVFHDSASLNLASLPSGFNQAARCVGAFKLMGSVLPELECREFRAYRQIWAFTNQYIYFDANLGGTFGDVDPSATLRPYPVAATFLTSGIFCYGNALIEVPVFAHKNASGTSGGIQVGRNYTGQIDVSFDLNRNFNHFEIGLAAGKFRMRSAGSVITAVLNAASYITTY